MDRHLRDPQTKSGRAVSFCVLLFLTSAISYGQHTVLLVYVNTGTYRDAQSMAALQSTVGGLNAGGNSAGYFYQLAYVNTFARAYELARDKPPSVNAVLGIAHKINGSDPMTLKDTTPDSEYAAEFDMRFIRSFHCEEAGDIDNDEIGRRIANSFFHKYRQTDGTMYDPSGRGSGNASGTGGDGGGTYSGGGTWVSWLLTGQYSYFDSNGTMHVVAYAYTVTVFIPDNGNSNDQLALAVPFPQGTLLSPIRLPCSRRISPQMCRAQACSHKLLSVSRANPPAGRPG